MSPLIAALLFITIPELIAGQSSQQEWLPHELFNPRFEPRKCGHTSGEPAFICDPNGLTGSHLSSFNWILRDAAYNGTRCPCSTYYCEHNDKPLGYHIGVALVKRMKIQAENGKYNSLEDQGQIFASNLKSRWNLGRCEEDIIIFYSHEDKVLAIYGGRTAMTKLTPYYRNLLSYRVGSRFSEGRIVEALNNLLYDLKLVLNCDSVNEYDCGLTELRSGTSHAGSSLFVALFCVFFSAAMFWKV